MAGNPIDELRSIVGADHVLVDADMRAGHEIDWTGRFGGPTAAVVRPGSTNEVASVAALCDRSGLAIVPQAGNSGLVGGGVPRSTEWHRDTGDDRPSIVLSLGRLRQLDVVDTNAMQVTVGAGVTLAEWRSHARAAGLDTPVDFAARDVATIGGAIATNAGGSRVLRFGTMRSQVVGIEAVLANGDIVGSLSGLPKETVGVHWSSLLAGSEGTLAIVTTARLRLVPQFSHFVTAMIAAASMPDAVALVGRLRRNVPTLDSVEFVEPAAMELVARHLGRRAPVAAPEGGTYAVVECAGHADPSDQLADQFDTDAATEIVATTDHRQRADLLEFRDRVTDAISVEAARVGVPTFKLDVAVPLDSLATIIGIAHDAARRDGARLIPFGHLAEGNVHLNFLDATDTDRIAQAVLEAVASVGGTISAEHGIGIAKTRWLHLVRSTADLAAQRALKLALDPNDTLNPGVLNPGVLRPPDAG